MKCHICSQIAGDSTNDLVATAFGGAYRRRIPTETDDFVVIPSLGAITVGHLLICPVMHLRRLADMPGALSNDYSSFTKRVLDVSRREFGESIHLFEHGSDVQGMHSPCTVEHAHLHLVPTPAAIVMNLPEDRRWMEVKPRPTEIAAAVGNEEYLYYEAPDGTAYVARAEGRPFESQLLRRMLCEAVGQEGWNWRDHPRLDVVDETEKRMRRACMLIEA